MAMSMDMGDVYESCFRRTVEIRVQGNGPSLTRYDFASYIEDVVGLDSLEACGPTARRGVYHLTFEHESDAEKFFDEGDFVVNDTKCFLDRVRIREKDQKCKVRVHRLPHYIPNSVVTNILERDGETKVITVYEDKCSQQGFEHVYSLTRTFVIRTKHIENVPYLCQWKFKDLSGKVFFTMAGRAPFCLRCHATGHINKDCETPFYTRCFKMGHLTKDCMGLTLADRVGGGPSAAVHEEYSDPEEQDAPVKASQPMETRTTDEAGKPLIDHFDSTVLIANNSVPLIDLSEKSQKVIADIAMKDVTEKATSDAVDSIVNIVVTDKVCCLEPEPNAIVNVISERDCETPTVEKGNNNEDEFVLVPGSMPTMESLLSKLEKEHSVVPTSNRFEANIQCVFVSRLQRSNC
jgi:hypothetical protein